MVVHRSGVRDEEVARALPCDDLLPDAGVIIDRATTFTAPPEAVWPWLTQIGKDRAGWYFPRSIERVIPPRQRGLRRLDPSFAPLAVGTEVLDWGPGSPTLQAVVVDEPSDLGFRSTRGRTSITWVLHLEPVGETGSRLQLRLRISRPADWLSPVIVYGGGLFDWLTVIGLFAGLRERLRDSP